jgi:hypothetical protein
LLKLSAHIGYLFAELRWWTAQWRISIPHNCSVKARQTGQADAVNGADESE